MTNRIQAIADTQVREFAESCYDQNQIADLVGLTPSDADIADCQTWSITETQWYDAIRAAAHDRLTDWVLNEFIPGCQSNDVDPMAVMGQFFNANAEIDDDGDVYADGWVNTERLEAFYRHVEA